MCRAAAVWCPQRHKVGLRVAVVLVVAIGIYSVATTVVSPVASIILYCYTTPSSEYCLTCMQVL